MRAKKGWILITTLLASLAISGCLQGESERCEVDWDCDDGLQCCSGSNTCQETCGGGQTDAAVDAAPPADASVEPDAEIPQDAQLLDAETTEDASP